MAFSNPALQIGEGLSQGAGVVLSKQKDVLTGRCFKQDISGENPREGLLSSNGEFWWCW